LKRGHDLFEEVPKLVDEVSRINRLDEGPKVWVHLNIARLATQMLKRCPTGELTFNSTRTTMTMAMTMRM
jgi:hypothetical protein